MLTNGLDEGILLTSIGYLGARTPAALVELGAPLTVMSGTPEILVSQPAFEPYVSTAHAMGARVVSVPAGPGLRVSAGRGRCRAITPNTRHRLRQQSEQSDAASRCRKRRFGAWRARPRHALVFVDEAYHDFLGENFLDEAPAIRT